MRLRPVPAPRIPAAFAFTLVLAAADPARAGVFLSELCDPQNNYQTDRYIEIYNSGPGVVDLTGWKIVAIGNTVDVNTWVLSGTIGVGEAKVAGSTAPVTAFPIHWASATWLTNFTNWNGNNGDGARLVNGSNVVLDLIVAPAPGLFENKTLVRNPNIVDPTPVYNASEWTATPVLTSPQATPGSHNGSTPPAGGPVITNIVTDPAAPAIGEPVDIEATVVDTSGAIAAVTLAWGTASGSQPNVIGMTVLSGDTYRTTAQIPGQPSGATIYYKVSAEGPVATTTSTLRSYLIPGGGTGVPPSVLAVGETSDSTLLVFFSEPVDEATAEIATHYTVGALAGSEAVRDPANPAEVAVKLLGIAPGNRTLTVNGVQDLEGNTAFGATRGFNWVDVSIPPGYYDAAIGLTGSALRVALHNRIRNHNVGSYAGALTAFQTTDVKPNGKVWDMYSDVPGGTPPYEYSFGQTGGSGATEGTGYNREHSWPDSWFGGSSPMHTDLWILYPTDIRVNNYRSNHPFGEVDVPTTTSLNGSRLGPSASPGYAGTVFEPIDAYKGDFARGQFYVATRYFGQDGSWPGSPSADGAEILPWARDQYRTWSDADPPSWKERMRNGAVYVIQGNRNPFVDHPEFLEMIYDSTATVGDPDMPNSKVALRANVPNPFSTRTTIAFDLPRAGAVTLRLYDVTGRAVRTLAAGTAMGAGPQRLEWDGRADDGTRVGVGLYFCRLTFGAESDVRRVVVSR
jgi:endonuclease I